MKNLCKLFRKISLSKHNKRHKTAVKSFFEILPLQTINHCVKSTIFAQFTFNCELVQSLMSYYWQTQKLAFKSSRICFGWRFLYCHHGRLGRAQTHCWRAYMCRDEHLKWQQFDWCIQRRQPAANSVSAIQITQYIIISSSSSSRISCIQSRKPFEH